MAYYGVLIEQPRDVNATDWNDVLANGGSTGSWTKLQLDSPDGIWKLSVKGLQIHMEEFRIIAMEYINKQLDSINMDTFLSDQRS